MTEPVIPNGALWIQQVASRLFYRRYRSRELTLPIGTVNGIQTSVRRIFEMVKSGLTTDKSYTQVCIVSTVRLTNTGLLVDFFRLPQYAQYFQGVGTEHVNKDTVDGNLIYIYRPGALRGSLTGAGIALLVFHRDLSGGYANVNGYHRLH